MRGWWEIFFFLIGRKLNLIHKNTSKIKKKKLALKYKKGIYGQLVKNPNWYENNTDMIVKCNNKNCIEEDTIDIFRLYKIFSLLLLPLLWVKSENHQTFK